LVVGSNPTGPSLQNPESKTLTEKANISSKPENKNLAEILFSESDIDPDLKLIIEKWPTLSLDLRRAIVKMVQ